MYQPSPWQNQTMPNQSNRQRPKPGHVSPAQVRPIRSKAHRSKQSPAKVKPGHARRREARAGHGKPQPSKTKPGQTMPNQASQRQAKHGQAKPYQSNTRRAKPHHCRTKKETPPKGYPIETLFKNVSMLCMTEGPGGKKIAKSGLPAGFCKFFPEYFDCTPITVSTPPLRD